MNTRDERLKYRRNRVLKSSSHGSTAYSSGWRASTRKWGLEVPGISTYSSTQAMYKNAAKFRQGFKERRSVDLGAGARTQKLQRRGSGTSQLKHSKYTRIELIALEKLLRRAKSQNPGKRETAIARIKSIVEDATLRAIIADPKKI